MRGVGNMRNGKNERSRTIERNGMNERNRIIDRNTRNWRI